MSKRSRILGILAQAGLADADLQRERERGAREAQQTAQWTGLLGSLVPAVTSGVGALQKNTAEQAALAGQEAIGAAGSSRGGEGQTFAKAGQGGADFGQSFKATPEAYARERAAQVEKLQEPKDQGFFASIGDLIGGGAKARETARVATEQGIAKNVAANRAADLAAAEKKAQADYGVIAKEKEHQQALELAKARAENALPAIILKGEQDKSIAQFKAEATAKEKAARAAAGAGKAAAKEAASTAKNATELRREFNQLQPVKDYTIAQTAMKKVEGGAKLNSPAGDFQIIYGTQNVVDPNSIVKESEASMVQNIGALDERVADALTQHVNGRRLTKSQIADLKNLAHSNLAAYKAGYDAQVERYADLATQLGTSIDAITGRKHPPPAKQPGTIPVVQESTFTPGAGIQRNPGEGGAAADPFADLR